MSTQEDRGEPTARAPQERGERPWYFEKTGPAFFNEWSVTHVGWGVLFQLLFPDRYVTGLVLHTIYESIEGYIFPAKFRDTSMRNHVGDTIAFAAGMLASPSPSVRPSTDTNTSRPIADVSEGRGRYR